MLTGKVIKRVELPHEPGEWVEVRMPSLSIWNRVAEDTHGWRALLEGCVLRWSYDDPVTPDNIADLDSETVEVLTSAVQSYGTKAEQKNSSGRSTKA